MGSNDEMTDAFNGNGLNRMAERLRTNAASNELSSRIVRWLLDDLRHSVVAVATAMRVSNSLVYRIKNGERSVSLGQLERLEESFGIPVPIMLWRAAGANRPRPANENVARLYDELGDSLRSLYSQHFTYAESLSQPVGVAQRNLSAVAQAPDVAAQG